MAFYDGEVVTVLERMRGDDASSVVVERHKGGAVINSFIVDDVGGGVSVKTCGNVTVLRHGDALTLLVGRDVVFHWVHVACFDVGDNFVVFWRPHSMQALVRVNFDGLVAWEAHNSATEPSKILVRGPHVFVWCGVELNKYRSADGSYVSTRVIYDWIVDVNDTDDVMLLNSNVFMTPTRVVWTLPYFYFTLHGFVSRNVFGIMNHPYGRTGTCTVNYIRINSGRKSTINVSFEWPEFNKHGIYGLLNDKRVAVDHCIVEESALATLGSAPWRAFWEKDGDHAIWSRVMVVNKLTPQMTYYDGEVVTVLERMRGEYDSSVVVSRYKGGVVINSFIVDDVGGGVSVQTRGNVTVLHGDELTLLVGRNVVFHRRDVRCFDIGDDFVVFWRTFPLPVLVRVNFDGLVEWEVHEDGIPTSIFVRGDHVFVLRGNKELSKRRSTDGTFLWTQDMSHTVADVNDVDDVVLYNNKMWMTPTLQLCTLPCHFGWHVTRHNFVCRSVFGVMAIHTRACTVHYIRINSGRKSTKNVQLGTSYFNKHGIWGLLDGKFVAIDHCIVEESALATVDSAPWRSFWEKDGDHAIWSRVLSFELE